jgi:hypothetical protein
MKKIYELHYAILDLQKDIPTYQLQEGIELNAFLLAHSNTECVYLISLYDEIYVTDNILHIINFIGRYAEKSNPMDLPKDVIAYFDNLVGDTKVNLFVQEYNSFEEAYKVALDMQEIKPLCYA